jgi:hypothetical protein
MTGRIRTMKARQSAVEGRPGEYTTACDAMGRDAVSSDASSSCFTVVPALRVSAYRGSARRQRN